MVVGDLIFLPGTLHRPAFIEVKSVTLHTGKGAGEFPDAVSERALKHVHALQRMVAMGHRGVLIFCAQHCGIDKSEPGSID